MVDIKTHIRVMLNTVVHTGGPRCEVHSKNFEEWTKDIQFYRDKGYMFSKIKFDEKTQQLQIHLVNDKRLYNGS